MQKSRNDRRKTKQLKIRQHLSGTSQIPRVSIYKSLNNFYAQLIDDEKHITLAAASTKDLEKHANNIDAVKAVAKLFAKKLNDIKVSQVVYDRSGYLYHGKVAAFADSLREEGIKF